jgi:hypothetical protein
MLLVLAQKLLPLSLAGRPTSLCGGLDQFGQQFLDHGFIDLVPRSKTQAALAAVGCQALPVFVENLRHDIKET